MFYSSEYNKKVKISFLKIIFILAFFLLPFWSSIVSANTLNNMSGWAWSSNIGWISFNCTNTNSCPNSTSGYGVNKDINGNLVGYAWSSNIGWIQFGGLSGFPSGKGTQAQNANLTGNNLKGWARALSNGGGWDGWISLSGAGPNYGVDLNVDNIHFSGYAWGSDVVGWISFSGTNYGVIVGANTNVCTNGATNYPACTIDNNGLCVNGATNPPSCVVGSYSGWSSCSVTACGQTGTQTAICVPLGAVCTLPAPTQACNTSPCLVNGSCSSPQVHYTCSSNSSAINQVSSPSKWTWKCPGSNGGIDALCSENKSPGYIED